MSDLFQRFIPAKKSDLGRSRRAGRKEFVLTDVRSEAECTRSDLNARPSVPKTDALSTELRVPDPVLRHFNTDPIIPRAAARVQTRRGK